MCYNNSPYYCAAMKKNETRFYVLTWKNCVYIEIFNWYKKWWICFVFAPMCIKGSGRMHQKLMNGKYVGCPAW